MKTQSLMGFKCRKPKIQSCLLFSLPLSMRSPFLLSQTMASCRDPEAATRKNIPVPVSTTQDQTGQVKIIRMAYLKLQREKLHRTSKKKTPRKDRQPLLSLKNLLAKHLRWGEKVCALKFSIANSLIVKKLCCVHVCRGHTKNECARPWDMAGLSPTSLILLGSTSLWQAGSLKSRGWCCWPVSSAASGADDFSHGICAQTWGGALSLSPGVAWAGAKLCIPCNSQPAWRRSHHSLTLYWPHSAFSSNLWCLWG